MPERFLRLTVAYDGTEFSGWQWQPDRRTVQGEVEEAVFRVTGERLRVVASGRTDAGVHALGQAVSMSTSSQLDPETIRRALNANLSRDVVVREVVAAPDDFHAIDDALSKRYRYLIQVGAVADVFARRYVWQIYHGLDEQLMEQAARLFCGRQDFRSLESSGSRRVSAVRNVMHLSVKREPADMGDRIVVEVEADGFLYNMVRNIVGTLVEVGRGKREPGWVAEVLAARDRRLAGQTAPPQGLYLVSVRFEF